jgi:hypothetical protein
MLTGGPEPRPRKLAANLAADVAGSSRLMAEDEGASVPRRSGR